MKNIRKTFTLLSLCLLSTTLSGCKNDVKEETYYGTFYYKLLTRVDDTHLNGQNIYGQYLIIGGKNPSYRVEIKDEQVLAYECRIVFVRDLFGRNDHLVYYLGSENLKYDFVGGTDGPCLWRKLEGYEAETIEEVQKFSNDTTFTFLEDYLKTPITIAKI